MKQKLGILDGVIAEQFTVPFSHVAIPDRGSYFVPKYAEARPASQAILSGNLYEPDTHKIIEQVLLHRPGNMVHAGTFFGDMLPTFSKYCPGTVYAFEPVLENYVLAKCCIEANGLRNIFLLNAGLNDRTALAYIDTGSVEEGHRGGSSRIGDGGQSVGLVSIDSLGLDNVSIIQLDVEGHELSALKGAYTTIRRCAPIIMVEDNLRACNAFLEALDYHCIGLIPGLFIWAQDTDRTMIKAVLDV